MENINFYFVASVEEKQIDSIHSIAKNLEELGCHISRIQTLTGIISGHAGQGLTLKDLKIEGIKYVEPDREIRSSK